MKGPHFLATPIAATALSGCALILPEDSHGRRPALMWSQSPLSPAGPEAASIQMLTWIMLAGGGLILLLVVAFAAYAILGGTRRSWIANRNFVIVFGIAMPVGVLTVLLVYGLALTTTSIARQEPAVRVEVVGERWWWRVNYLGPHGVRQFETANEIRIPTSVPVEFVLKSNDVIHSFWVPSLAGKLDMIPGRINRYQFSAGRAGVYRGQCAEYCGAQHALMAFYVVAMDHEQYLSWLEDQKSSASEPTTEATVKGKALFASAGCGACHSIRGTIASGQIGPDLTHFGSRRSLAAGSFENDPETVSSWIASPQHLKPGNLMPPFSHLQGGEIRAISYYLESLK